MKKSSTGYSNNAKEELLKLKNELKRNLLRQEKLSEIYIEGLLAKEAYTNQIIPFRDEEREFKAEIRKLELSLIEKERSSEYKNILKSVISHVDTIKTGLDIAGKKGLLKLVFKSIKVKNGRIKSFELYEPFKSLYEGVKIKCKIKENQRVIPLPQSVITSRLSVVR